MENSLLQKYILRKDSKKRSVYRYTDLTATLLAEVTGVAIETIKNTKVYSRSRIRYIPFYLASRGGGAITLGNKKWHSITFTENFFSADKELYGNAAYANKVDTWLRLSAHEVGHLVHSIRYGSLLIYLAAFIYQYLKYGHDDAPLEKEAENGRYAFIGFKTYVDQSVGPDALVEMISSTRTEKDKIRILKTWLTDYKS